jgi:hypothetical protein
MMAFPTPETQTPPFPSLAIYAGGDFCLILLSGSINGRRFAPLIVEGISYGKRRTIGDIEAGCRGLE